MTGLFTKVFIDLDRTIFDTAKFFNELWDTVGELSGTDIAQPKARADKFRVYQGDLFNYEFFRHLEAEGLVVSEQSLVEKLRQPGRFVYKDVVPAWPYLATMAEPQILTYGGTDYQHLKIACCPELDNVTVVNVLETKADYFKRELPGVPALLIDDKDLAGELPVSVTFVQVRRNDDAEVTRHHGYVAVNSFSYLEEALSTL